MESKYTKGPWRLTDWDDKTFSVSVDRGEPSHRDEPIAFEVFTIGNAKLIAAAPELLEALIKCKPYLLEMQAENFTDPTVGMKEDAKLTEAVKLIQAAILKATSI